MNRYLFIIPIAILLAACELVVPIELPDQTPRLVINSFLYADSIPVRASISRSYGMYENIQFDSVADVRVFLSVDNQPEVEMSRSKVFVFVPNVFEDSTTTITAGRRYRIRAAAPGYQDAYGETTVPDRISFTDAVVTPQALIEDEDTLDAVDLTFADPSGGNNRYALFIRASDGFAGTYDLCFQTADPLLADADLLGGGGTLTTICQALFRDELIDGNTYTLRLYLRASEIQWINGDIQAVLLSMDEAMYNYWVSSDLQQGSAFNPFAEPVIVSNTIENGFGIVGSCNASSIQLPY